MNAPSTDIRVTGRKTGATPPGVYAFIFVGVTGLIGFLTMIAAVAVA